MQLSSMYQFAAVGGRYVASLETLEQDKINLQTWQDNRLCDEALGTGYSIEAESDDGIYYWLHEGWFDQGYDWVRVFDPVLLEYFTVPSYTLSLLLH